MPYDNNATNSTTTAQRSWWPLTRRSLVALWASPSTYLLAISAMLTLAAKALTIGKLDLDESAFLTHINVHLIDLLFYFGLATLFAAGESISNRIHIVTIFVSAIVASLSAINAPLLLVTGSQLDASTLFLGFERSEITLAVASNALGPLGIFFLATGLCFLVAIPLILNRQVRDWPTDSAQLSRERAVAALGLASVSLLLLVVLPPERSFAAKRLKENAVIATYVTMILHEPDGPSVQQANLDSKGVLHPYAPEVTVPAEQIESLRSGRRPNVLVLVLESTRFDIVHGQNPRLRASVPNMWALINRGSWARTAYSAFPHTTKSLFSILCGRLPTMQATFFEIGSNPFPQCMPRVMRESGYDTYYAQSALGAFERRPYFIHQLGYETFESWETVGGAPTGYLSSDDRSLGPAFASWLESKDADRPFLATLLTSGPHHPYSLSPEQEATLASRGIDPDALSPAARYAKLVEFEDELLGALTKTLEKTNKLDDTIIVLVGDHGEGFGGHGIQQHDNNFYQEGIHVPFVLAGPGVPAQAIEGTVSLTDVVPTLYDLIGLDWSPSNGWEFGVSALKSIPKNRVAHFMCYHPNRCQGFIADQTKVIVEPSQRRAFAFDLANDPSEQTPLSLTSELASKLDLAVGQIQSRQFDSKFMQRESATVYEDWKCEETCIHPRTPADRFLVFSNKH